VARHGNNQLAIKKNTVTGSDESHNMVTKAVTVTSSDKAVPAMWATAINYFILT